MWRGPVTVAVVAVVLVVASDATHNLGGDHSHDGSEVGAPCDDCPEDFFKAQPCTSTVPTCEQCSPACADDEVEIRPCGFVEDECVSHDSDGDRVCMQEYSLPHKKCEEDAVPLTLDDLLEMTQGECANCAQLVPYINQALAEGEMLCPLRIAAFIAHVRHGTDGFEVFYQESSMVAGAIHMTEANWRLACTQIPELEAAFEEAFPRCSKAPNFCECGQGRAAELVGSPEQAFRIGVWWFKEGATQVLGEPCGDLRFDADKGLGGSLFETTRESPGEGFQKTTTCIAGFGVDEGRQQRAEYYEVARAAYPCAKTEAELLAAAPARVSAASLAAAVVLAAAAAAVAAEVSAAAL